MDPVVCLFVYFLLPAARQCWLQSCWRQGDEIACRVVGPTSVLYHYSSHLMIEQVILKKKKKRRSYSYCSHLECIE